MEAGGQAPESPVSLEEGKRQSERWRATRPHGTSSSSPCMPPVSGPGVSRGHRVVWRRAPSRISRPRRKGLSNRGARPAESRHGRGPGAGLRRTA